MPFHDGTILNAHDVVYKLETNLDPDFKARFRPLFMPISTLEAPFDDTIV